jgi:hypothetical protein
VINYFIDLILTFGSKEGREEKVRYGSQGKVMYFKPNLLLYP